MTAPVIEEPGVSGRTGGFSQVARRIRRDPWAFASVIVVVVFALAAIFAPLLTAVSGQDPYTYHLKALDDSGAPLGFGGGISATHWFGVEPLTGRDLFSIVVFGARTSLGVGVSASLLSVAVGVTVGLSAGYFGGWYERIVTRVIDVFLGLPWLIFMIALTAVVAASFPRPLLIVLVMVILFGWPSVARVIRGQTLSLRERNFVTASAAMGAGAGHVIFRQLLPNVSATLIVYATILVPGMIGTEAALSFLGVGVPPPTPSWGRTLGDAVSWVQTDPMYLVFPGAALFLVTLSFNLLGDGLRDALDPRARSQRR